MPSVFLKRPMAEANAGQETQEAGDGRTQKVENFGSGDKDAAHSAKQREKENLRNRTSYLITNLSHSPLLRQKDVHAALPIQFLHVANKDGRS